MYNDTVAGVYPVSPACLAVLRLSHVKGLGLKSFHQLYEHFFSVESILSASYEDLLSTGVRPKLAQSIIELDTNDLSMSGDMFERVFEWAAKKDNYVLCLEDEHYPSSLKEIYCPPPLLYVQGQLSAFKRTSIAIIGSRRPSLYGQKQAKLFAKTLAQSQFCITSGLAIGIDTLAHHGALEAGGISCGVLGSGLESIYPKQNQKLAMALKEQGVLMSELGLDVAALPANFPRRNRIISGLSQGILVVEAGLKSGSLITANFAIEQSREVFAMPGAIDNPLAKGCHELIKQGAFLVDDVQDVLNVLGSDLSMQQRLEGCVIKPERDFSHLSLDEQKVISVLGSQSTNFDDLLHCLGMEVAHLNTLLVTLELKGELSAVAGGYQRI